MPDNLNVRRYQLQFRDLLMAVFNTQSYFNELFAGGLEALDGVSESATAFTVKTSDIPVVVGTYGTGTNVAFGTGTANTTRFGPRTEIIYVNTDVPYEWNWSIHEGIDRFTVNNDLDAAIADRLELQAQAKVRMFNTHAADFINTNATAQTALASYDEADVIAMVDGLSAALINAEAVGQKVLAVNTGVYNALINSGLTIGDKGSTINIDGNDLPMFKDFAIRVLPDSVMGANAAFAYIAGMAKVFTGINTTRTIESEDFDGVALQAAGKAGHYIPPANLAALLKVAAPVSP